MASFEELAQKKVGGIPVLWIGIVIAAIALYGAFRLKPAPEVTEEDIAAEDAAEDEEGDFDTDQPVFSATPVIMQPSGPSVASTPMEDTNELWGRRSIEWLTANGYSLTLATSAITKYLDGSTLSMQEAEARDKAVKQYGLPPEGLLPTKTAGDKSPASAQGVPPTRHTVRGERDNQPAELARVYYGINNADAINLIDAANPTVPKPYRVGQVVKIPEYRQPKYFKATSAVRSLYEIARKNGSTPQKIAELNPGMKFPVAVGTRVRIR